MPSTISVVIPAHNAASHLLRCLTAIQRSSCAPHEVIVVDDASRDNTALIAADLGAIVLSTGTNKGPAFARNLGALKATGDILFFLDADVCVQPDTIEKVFSSFNADPALDALIGSYDTHPSEPDFISQYRNLMHCFVHQTGAENASTFWSGCGAIRRSIFSDHSGFDEGYGRPAIEDIELGYRLIRAGQKILLDRSIQVTHMKRWTFLGLVKTDIFDRGIPWTELILRDRRLPNDLNLQLSQRVSVALVYLLVGLCSVMTLMRGSYALIPLFVIVFLMLARWWGEMGNYERPRIAFALLTGTLAIAALAAYLEKMFVLIPFLAVTPVLLFMRHRYNRRGSVRHWHRMIGIFFLCGAVVTASMYLPAHHLIVPCFAIMALIGLLNSQFYIFLASNRGYAFMLAAIPFHLLFHFYNGISFIAGTSRYLLFDEPLRKKARTAASTVSVFGTPASKL